MEALSRHHQNILFLSAGGHRDRTAAGAMDGNERPCLKKITPVMRHALNQKSQISGFFGSVKKVDKK